MKGGALRAPAPSSIFMTGRAGPGAAAGCGRTIGPSRLKGSGLGPGTLGGFSGRNSLPDVPGAAVGGARPKKNARGGQPPPSSASFSPWGRERPGEKRGGLARPGRGATIRGTARRPGGGPGTFAGGPDHALGKSFQGVDSGRAQGTPESGLAITVIRLSGLGGTGMFSAVEPFGLFRRIIR